MKVAEIKDEAIREIMKKDLYKPVGRRMKNVADHYTQILCLGDSITYGSRDYTQGGYPIKLERLLTARSGYPHICINAGISHETSSEIQRRAWKLMNDKDIKIVCLIMGTNDSKALYRWDTRIYRDNLISIVRYARCMNQRLIVGTMPILIPGLQSEYDEQSPEYISELRLLIKDLSVSENFEVVDLYEFFEKNKDWLEDGVHPRNEGYEAIATIFAEKIMLL